MEISDRLKIVRGNYTQAEFARKIESPQSTIANYETGASYPKSEFLGKLNLKFGVNINWLLTGHGEMYSDPEKSGKPINKEGDGNKPEIESNHEMVSDLQAKLNGQASLGQMVDLLARIMGSDNRIFAQAVTVNLKAFAAAIEIGNQLGTLGEELKVMSQENSQFKKHQDEINDELVRHRAVIQDLHNTIITIQNAVEKDTPPEGVEERRKNFKIVKNTIGHQPERSPL